MWFTNTVKCSRNAGLGTGEKINEEGWISGIHHIPQFQAGNKLPLTIHQWEGEANSQLFTKSVLLSKNEVTAWQIFIPHSTNILQWPLWHYPRIWECNRKESSLFSANIDFPVWKRENKQANDIMSGAQQCCDEKYRWIRGRQGRLHSDMVAVLYQGMVSDKETFKQVSEWFTFLGLVTGHIHGTWQLLV